MKSRAVQQSSQLLKDLRSKYDDNPSLRLKENIGDIMLQIQDPEWPEWLYYHVATDREIVAAKSAVLEYLLSLIRDDGTNMLNALDSSEGKTPLHHAVEQGLVDCVRLLLFKGADLEAKSRTFETPLDVLYRIPDIHRHNAWKSLWAAFDFSKLFHTANAEFYSVAHRRKTYRNQGYQLHGRLHAKSLQKSGSHQAVISDFPSLVMTWIHVPSTNVSLP